jgi:hypothetical protein
MAELVVGLTRALEIHDIDKRPGILADASTKSLIRSMGFVREDLHSLDFRRIHEEIGGFLDQRHCNFTRQVSVPRGFVRKSVEDRERVAIEPEGVPGGRALLLLSHG